MILAKAHEEQARILNEAVATRERILKEAKTQAQVEGQKLLDEAKKADSGRKRQRYQRHSPPSSCAVCRHC